MKMNEEATFAVYQKKLKGICEENDLQATFNRSGYPLTMTVRPLQDVADQMPVVSSLDHLPTDGEFYSNNCVDGHCIGCGECCTDLLPTTRREIVRLRDYAKKHQLKEHRLPAGAAMESVDLTCPFRNEDTKRCDVYPVRPLICRAFICSRTLQAARKTRDLVQSDRDIHSLRWEIFKNPESIALIQAAQRAATKK